MLGIFGTISSPINYTGYDGLEDFAILGSSILSLLTTLAGIFVMVNFIIAGYGYLAANGNPQQIANAGNKILQSLIGLIIIAAAYIIAAIIGFVFFNDPGFLIKPMLTEIIP